MIEHVPSRSPGSCLRALREKRQSSLADIARATRVAAYQLEALESDRFSELPAPVFVKGFIRAYCHFLDEPAEEPLRRYRDLLDERPAPEPPAPVRRPGAAWMTNPVLISLALLVVFGSGLLAVNLVLKQGPQRAAPPADPAANDQAFSAPPTPLVSNPTAGSDAAESPSPQRLVVRAIEPTWIRIQTDDGRTEQETLPAGATREWTTEKRFLLTVGNAGGIEIELNGRPMPRLGESGAVIRKLELPQAAAAGS
jgi:cytoskeleton protein RodZ